MIIDNETTDDRMSEWANETNAGLKDEWISENFQELINEFVEDNPNEFNELLEQAVIDKERDLDYWKENFCNDEMNKEFNDFVNDRFLDRNERWLKYGM